MIAAPLEAPAGFPALGAVRLPPIETGPAGKPSANGVAMVRSLAVLVACQAGGEMLHTLVRLPLPGPVLGIGLLLLGLVAARLRHEPTSPLPAADLLLSYLPLFLVPPGVSALMQVGRLAHLWPAVLLSLVASSTLTLLLVGRLAQALLARTAPRTTPQKTGT